jgi:hypothetical protein
MAQQLPVMCPSGRCVPGALLLGVVQGDGSVGFLKGRLAIDEAFVASAKAAGDPERRLRFSEPCVQGACHQWDGARCGVIEGVLASGLEGKDGLPDCAIRPACRWFVQRGAEACAVCPFVVTEQRPHLQVAPDAADAAGFSFK